MTADDLPGPAADEAGRRRMDRDTVFAVFAAVLYLALLVCAFGFVSLLADVDVVSREGTGRFVGPAMVATAVVVVLVALVREARRPRRTTDRVVRWPLVIGLGAALGFTGAGVVIVAVESGRWFDGVVFASSTLMSAFPWIAGGLAAVVVVAFGLVTTEATSPRPRWPWEREDEEEW
ncbi:DUF6121 family protein [Labedella endophytica]|uniref:Uncharacterized protein n=1 Tax=Labedella endophytica TaxID=1523160 RepID=A0A3S0VEE0_9MICO|nr:DUF6121 family protein [Labedella endophytica]RUQ98870.1 hypothetical protein ELQ94_11060 [Labedella endophytica]